MSRINFILWLSLLFAVPIFCQRGLSPSTKISAAHGSIRHDRPAFAVGGNDSLAYFLEYHTEKGPTQRVLWAVGSEAATERNFVLPMEYEGSKMDFQRLVLSHDGRRLHLFTSYNNRRTDVSYLLVTTIDALRLETIGKPRVILELEGATGKNNDYWAISQTESTGRCVVTYYVDGEGKALAVHMAVLNPDMTVAFEHIHTARTKDERRGVLSLAVGADATLYYCSNKGKADRRRATSAKSYVLHAVSPDGKVASKDLTLKDYELTELPKIVLKADGSLLAFGRLHDGKRDDYPGFYFYTYDGKTLSPIVRQQRMANETRTGLISLETSKGKLSKDNRKFMERFGNAKLLEIEGGGVYAIGTSKKYKSLSNANNIAPAKDMWTYRNVLVTYISPEGIPLWSRTLPLLAEHENWRGNPIPYTGGMAAEILGDQLLIAYYDDIRNVRNMKEFPSYRTLGLWKKMAVRYVLFSSQGDCQSGKDRRFTETKKLVLFPRISAPAPDGSGIIFSGMEKGDIKFVSVRPITKK